jgi:hypothetical protein
MTTRVQAPAGHARTPTRPVPQPARPQAASDAAALARALGNRAFSRLVVARWLPTPPTAPLPPQPQPSRDAFEIHPDAMTLLETKLKALYAVIPRRDRIWLHANSTVAIGMATVDGEPRLVYTVANNKGSRAFHAAAERLDLHRWTYDTGVNGRGAVGAPNDAEQLMRGFARDNHATLHGLVLNRRMCADCEIVFASAGGGQPRVAVVPDPEGPNLPNPRNPPSRTFPPAETVHGEIDTTKKPPPGSPPGTRNGPTPRGKLPPDPAQTPTTTTTKAPAVAPPDDVKTPSSTRPPSAPRAAIVPVGIMGASFLIGLGLQHVMTERFREDWANKMEWIKRWLTIFLPTERSRFRPGAPLYAIVHIEISGHTVHMGPGTGFSPTQPGVRIKQIQVGDHPTPELRWIEENPWWTRLLGFTYESTHIKFSFPLPAQ